MRQRFVDAGTWDLGKTGETRFKAAFGTTVPFILLIHLASLVEAKVN